MLRDAIESVFNATGATFEADLLELNEGPTGWDAGPDEISAAFDEAAALVSQKLRAEPFHRGVGSLLSSISMPMTPEPARGLFISAWKNEALTAYLVVTSHDFDKRRCLNLAVFKS